MNMELFFNLLNILFAFGANNWLSAGISIVVFLYNLFLKLRKRKILAFLYENQKENNTAGNRTSSIFKIKFIVYTLISMFALCMAVLHFFDDLEYTERFKKRKVGTDPKTGKVLFEDTTEKEIVLSRYKVLT